MHRSGTIAPSVHVVGPTRYGYAAIVWMADKTGPQVLRVMVCPGGTDPLDLVRVVYPQARPDSCRAVEGLGRLLERIAAGRPAVPGIDLLETGQCAPLQRAVLGAVAMIPQGMVSTYGLIARHLDRPGSARAVGRVLAANPFPLLIPCHRVVCSDRRVGGYQGGTPMKRALLQAEGIRFDEDGRVTCDRFWYQCTGPPGR